MLTFEVLQEIRIFTKYRMISFIFDQIYKNDYCWLLSSVLVKNCVNSEVEYY